MRVEREDLMEVDIMDTPDTTNLKTIEEFARQNKVKANKKRRVCGDDRFEATQSDGGTRLFGGDEGALTAIKAASKRAEIDIDPNDLVEKYEKVIKQLFGQDIKLEVHTAKHALETGGIGCGFMDKAINVPGLHENLSNDDARNIHKAVLARPHKEIILDGEHAAQGVIMIHGHELSVNSRDEHSQNFVVDIDSAKDFLRTITPMLEIYGLQADDVVGEFESQMKKTSQQLAAGKNIFDVNFDIQGHPTATFSGTVPAPELQN